MSDSCDKSLVLSLKTNQPWLPALASDVYFSCACCRWGYQTLSDVQQVVSSYSAAQIPLDAIWTDIDYSKGGRGSAAVLCMRVQHQQDSHRMQPLCSTLGVTAPALFCM